jgi:hypothetical protein
MGGESSLGREDGRDRYSVWLLLPRIFKCLAKGVASTCGRLSPSPHDASPAVFRSHQTRTTSIMRPRNSSYTTYTHMYFLHQKNETTRHPVIVSKHIRKCEYPPISTLPACTPNHYLQRKKTRNPLISSACQSSITIPLLHQLIGYKTRRNQPLEALSKLVVLSRHRPPKVS